MKRSMITSKYRTGSVITLILSILLNVGPLLFFVIQGLSNDTLAYQKVALCSTVLIVGIMTAVNLLFRISMRSRVWIILIGLYLCLNHFLVAIFIIGATQILDELFISPLHKHYKSKYSINREIDKREFAQQKAMEERG